MNRSDLKECDGAEHVPYPPDGLNLQVESSALRSQTEAAARLFRALGDGPRFRLAAHLLSGERCVGELAHLEAETLSTISQRLRILHTENVVVRRRIGKHVNYALADAHIAELIGNALAHAIEE